MRVFFEPRVVKATYNTIIIGIGTMAICLFFGVVLAWLTARTDLPWKNKLELLNLVPFFICPIMGVVGWRILLSPTSGLINRFIINLFSLKRSPFSIYGLGGIIWVLGLYYTPYVYLMISSSLRKMDSTLEEAARIHGCGIIPTMLRITLALNKPSILAAAILVFMHACEATIVIYLLGVPYGVESLSTLVYDAIRHKLVPDFEFAATISFILVIPLIVMLFIREKIASDKKKFAVISSKGYRPQIIELGKWRYVALIFNMVYVALAVILPIIALVLVSISKAWVGYFDPTKLTLKNFYYCIFQGTITRRGLLNSLILASVGGVIGTVIALIIGITIYKTNLKVNKILVAVSSLTAAIPGSVLGLFYLFTWIKSPLYKSIWLLLLCYLARYLPFAVNNISSGLLAINPELEESARISGASWFITQLKIIMPLMMNFFISSFILLFVVFIRETGTSMMLWTYGTETVGVVIMHTWEAEGIGVMSAYTLIVIIIVLCSVAALQKSGGMKALMR
ncbi:MAG: iron ABC transporter permease [Candidatus Bathyarchaeia archaeon]